MARSLRHRDEVYPNWSNDTPLSKLLLRRGSLCGRRLLHNMYAVPIITRVTTGTTMAIEIAAVEIDLVDARDVDTVGNGVEGALIGKDGIDAPVVEIVRVSNAVELAELA